MTNEEARAYFIDCNKRIISVVKDENGYNYETKQIKDVFMRRTFEANELAIKALEHDPQETVSEFADRCRECGAYYGRLLNQKWIPVSERLPKKFSYVNCTCHSLIDYREDWVVETCYVPQPSNSPYSDWGNIPMLNDGDCEVVAWMYREIPEPYKAEGSSET